MRSIGLYPGTFDPVHLGHIAFAKEAIRACSLDEVVFLSEACPRGKLNVTDIVHRMAMLKLVAKGAADLSVLRLESERFTIGETLPELERVFGAAAVNKPIFLIGSDIVRGLSMWEGLNVLIRRVNFAIGIRKHDSQTDIDLAMQDVQSVYGPAGYTYIKTQVPHMNSSLVRSGAVDNSTLHPALLSYIAKHGLY